uniref:Calcineurin-like phosphoesterase domain-containing protein n=1 Tax=Alexandrium catenella TaxID=2925 RepID=A0A7S1MDK0_ALECA
MAVPLALFLQGCGEDDGSSPVVGGTPTTTTTTTPPPQTTVQAGFGNSSRRLGSFLVIGDWGWDPQVHGHITSRACQQAIADAMGEKARELGDVKFVVNVGDSFYPDGVVNRSDPKWDSMWRNVYPSEVRSVPWYSVYGNHDLFYDTCACSNDLSKCAQVNGDANDLNFFYMPNYTWFKSHPELGLEVIAMDMNQYSGFNWAAPGAPEWCLGYPALLRGQRPCNHHCWGSLYGRTQASLQLFKERLAASQARNLVVFSHYPTDYFVSLPDFLAGLRSTRHRIEYFGGHRHNVDDASTVSTAPNHNWLSGGGGGWSVDGGGQGFIVGQVGEDYTLQTYPILVDAAECRP